MRLREFLPLYRVEEAQGELDQQITGLSYDSRNVAPGHVFFAVPGEKADGHDFIPEALARGAAAIVAARRLELSQRKAFVQVDDVRRAMGTWAAFFYGRPSDSLKLVGITGTNGKTTVSYLIETIFAAAGLSPGVIGTVNYRYRGRCLPSHHTTPESIDLHALLADMRASEVHSVAMEVSSHALAQGRVSGVEFDAAVFTNLSRDHLDYHADMNAYFAAKRALFTDHLARSRKPARAAVIYGEDPHGRELIEEGRARGLQVWSYGERGEWDVRPVHVDSDVDGLRGRLDAKGQSLDFSSNLIGAANLQNIMGAAAATLALGISPETVTAGIRGLRSVPGRLERVENTLGITILVDYAHTPDALEKVLAAVRPLTPGRIVTVFGCGGDRDRGKRPLMGTIAARSSDFVVLTSDNPRTEDPLMILAQIEEGVKETGTKKSSVPSPASGVPQRPMPDAGRETRVYFVEPDRRLAIRLALELARSGDLVLIAGKGHEDYQLLRSGRIRFDDRDVAREEAGRRAEADAQV